MNGQAISSGGKRKPDLLTLNIEKNNLFKGCAMKRKNQKISKKIAEEVVDSLLFNIPKGVKEADRQQIKGLNKWLYILLPLIFFLIWMFWMIFIRNH